MSIIIITSETITSIGARRYAAPPLHELVSGRHNHMKGALFIRSMEINMSHPLEDSGRDGRGGSGTEPANSSMFSPELYKYAQALAMIYLVQSHDPQHSPDHSIPPSDPVLFISEADPLVPSTPHQPVKRNFLKRELGLISTTALTLNLILGSGILITPSSILRNTGSFGLSLVLWGVGGVITYAASFCYLELALLIKKSGSTYIYIKEAYSFTRSKPWMEVCGSLLGFLMAWTNVAIVEPLGLTIALLALGRYVFLCHSHLGRSHIFSFQVPLSATFS